MNLWECGSEYSCKFLQGSALSFGVPFLFTDDPYADSLLFLPIAAFPSAERWKWQFAGTPQGRDWPFRTIWAIKREDCYRWSNSTCAAKFRGVLFPVLVLPFWSCPSCVTARSLLQFFEAIARSSASALHSRWTTLPLCASCSRGSDRRAPSLPTLGPSVGSLPGN